MRSNELNTRFSYILAYIEPILRAAMATQNTTPEMKMLRRAKSSFTSNKTAALSLPDTWITYNKKTSQSLSSEKKEEEKEKIETKDTHKVTNSSSSNFSNFNFSELPSFSSITSFATYQASLIYSQWNAWRTQPTKIDNKIEALTEKKETKETARQLANKKEILKRETNIVKRVDHLRKKFSDTKTARKKDEIICDMIDLIEGVITEHAARRTDLFFYLLVAVHDKNLIIEKDYTLRQHGVGSLDRRTHACHSSLFPNIKIKTAPQKWYGFFTKPDLPDLHHTHLMDSLNMTVELPEIVNTFDGFALEGRSQVSTCTNTCLEILNKVSANKMTITEGMDAYFAAIHERFSYIETKKLKDKKLACPKANLKIFNAEKAGVFNGAKENSTKVDENYIYLMLRMREDDIKKVKKDPKNLAEFYKKMQEEIFAAKIETKKRKVNKK